MSAREENGRTGLAASTLTRMRRRPASTARALTVGLAVSASASIFGCTFLISFDEIPNDANAAEGGTPDVLDVDGDVPDAPVPEGGTPPFPPPCDPDFPVEEVNCESTVRRACARRGTIPYPPGRDPANDLVVCNGNKTAACVQHCPFGCAVTPDGFPDQCDDCQGRPNGYYCGRDLRGWELSNLDLAIECENGRAITIVPCGAGKCASSCPRAGGPKPACCVP